jgi:hypothetical protein
VFDIQEPFRKVTRAVLGQIKGKETQSTLVRIIQYTRIKARENGKSRTKYI